MSLYESWSEKRDLELPGDAEQAWRDAHEDAVFFGDAPVSTNRELYESSADEEPNDG